MGAKRTDNFTDDRAGDRARRFQSIYAEYLPRLYGYVAARVDDAAFGDRTGDWSLRIQELVGFGASGADALQTRISGAWVFDFAVSGE